MLPLCGLILEENTNAAVVGHGPGGYLQAMTIQRFGEVECVATAERNLTIVVIQPPKLVVGTLRAIVSNK